MRWPLDWLVIVQSLNRVWFFVIPWTAAHQASLSVSVFWSLFRLLAVELVMPSNHLILCDPLLFCLQSFPASRSFPVTCLFASGGQSIRASASASVLPMNIQGWFPLGLADYTGHWWGPHTRSPERRLLVPYASVIWDMHSQLACLNSKVCMHWSGLFELPFLVYVYK